MSLTELTASWSCVSLSAMLARSRYFSVSANAEFKARSRDAIYSRLRSAHYSSRNARFSQKLWHCTAVQECVTLPEDKCEASKWVAHLIAAKACLWTGLIRKNATEERMFGFARLVVGQFCARAGWEWVNKH